MKLVSFNLGIRIDNTKKVIDFLIEQDADIVCLQEVAEHKEDSVSEMFHVKNAIDKALSEKYPHRFFSPLFKSPMLTRVTFGGFVEQGNYIISKFPIKNSINEFFHRKYKKVEDWKEMNAKVEDHGRALQVVDLAHSDQTLRIMNLHGVRTPENIGDQRTLNEINCIIKHLNKKDVPTIVAGDFNLLPESESIKLLGGRLKNLVVKNNIDVTRPDFKSGIEVGNTIVDYIFINDRITCEKLEVIKTEISDHYPLVMNFDIKK